jgi:hypothetical protein
MENLALKVERMATFLRAHVACHLDAPVYGMCGCIWTPPYCNGLFGLVQDHDC